MLDRVTELEGDTSVFSGQRQSVTTGSLMILRVPPVIRVVVKGRDAGGIGNHEMTAGIIRVPAVPGVEENDEAVDPSR